MKNQTVVCVKCRREFRAQPFVSAPILVRLCDPGSEPEAPVVLGLARAEHLVCPVWSCSGELRVVEPPPEDA